MISNKQLSGSMISKPSCMVTGTKYLQKATGSSQRYKGISLGFGQLGPHTSESELHSMCGSADEQFLLPQPPSAIKYLKSVMTIFQK